MVYPDIIHYTFKNIPEEQRLCVLCDLREVVNESNFLLYCPFYDVLTVCSKKDNNGLPRYYLKTSVAFVFGMGKSTP